MKKFLNKVKDGNIRKGLYYSVLDGIVWAMMFGLSENYVIPFALLFGATVFQVSLIQGFGQLGTGLSQLAGARFIGWFKKRKLLSITGNIIHASSWVLVFLFTSITGNPWFVVIFYSLGLCATNFAGPGWISWMNDLMPQKIRGEYWGLRNRIIGIAQFLSISAAGVTLYFSKSLGIEKIAYGVLFLAGFAFRFSSVFFLSRQHEPPIHVTEESQGFTFLTFLKKMPVTNFGRFVLFSILLTFCVNLLGPVLPVYLLQRLNLNYLQFTIVMMLGTITAFIFMTYWGPLSDRYGNYRILIISSICLPLLALGWVFIKNFYLLIPMQIFGGFVWAGVNMSTSNYIFDAVRRENMSRVMSYFTMLNAFCAFLGSVTGGFITDLLLRCHIEFGIFNGFTIVFFLSALTRFAVILIYRKGFKEVREAEKSPAFHYFYVYKPALEVMDFFQGINDRIFKKKNR